MNRGTVPAAAQLLRRVRIGALQPGDPGVLVVGVILAKRACRSFPGPDGQPRFVTEMTLRDSPQDWINLTLWLGQAGMADEIERQFHVGQVVEVGQPKVQPKPSGQRFSPVTSSPFQLVFSDPPSTIAQHPEHRPDLQQLLHLPTKSLSYYYTLADIQSNPHIQSGNEVDLLGAIRSVGPIRKFKAKSRTDPTGAPIEREVREIRLFDQMCSNLILKLWDSEWIHLAQDWIPTQDMLFLADVRVDQDDYKHCKVVTATSKSIITVNPICEEAQNLAKYAKHANFSLGAQVERSVSSIDYQTIRKVSNVVNLQDIVSIKYKTMNEADYPTILLGYVTRLDLDAEVSRSVQLKCSQCHAMVLAENKLCSNMDCSAYNNHQYVDRLVQKWNLRMDIADSTGTLQNCRVDSEAADRLICEVGVFVNLPSPGRTQLKWDICLEPMRLWLLVLLPNEDRARSSVAVLNWEKISLADLAKDTPIPPVQ